MEVLHVEFRASLVLLAAAISFMGTHGAVSMCEQVRIALSSVDKPKRHHHLLAVVGLSLGGIGIWGTFYIALNALRLRTSTGDIVSLHYNPGLVASTVFISSAIAYIAVYVASTDECFCKSKADIMELFIARVSKTKSIGEIKRMGKVRILIHVCTSSVERVVAGGLITGGAISLMLYLGVTSTYIPGHIKFHPGYLAVAIIYSFIGAPVGFWVFFRVLSVFNSLDLLRTFCSANGMFVFCGVYFIALAGAKFEYNPSHSLPSKRVDNATIVVGVLVTTVMASFFVIMYVLADLRAWLLRASLQLHLADQALLAVLNRPVEHRGEGVAPAEDVGETTTMGSGGQGEAGAEDAHSPSKGGVPIPEVACYAALYLRAEPHDRRAQRPSQALPEESLLDGVETGDGAGSAPQSPHKLPAAGRIGSSNQGIPTERSKGAGWNKSFDVNSVNSITLGAAFGAAYGNRRRVGATTDP